MSTSSSGSGSDTTIDPHDSTQSCFPLGGSNSKRKSVIDTRRAEQNRAAQRAFRQRKALHVKELENKVRDMEKLKDRLERLELENDRLKYRLWELESTSKSASDNNNNHLPPLTTSSPPPRSYSDDNSLNHNDTPPFYYHDSNSIDRTVEAPKRRPSKPLESIRPLLRSPPPQLPPPPPLPPSSITPITHPILPPPSPSPSLFRPIPVSYWDKNSRSDEQYYQPQNSEQGQALDDLATILRTHHRPPIPQPQPHPHPHPLPQSQEQHEPMHT